MRYSNFDFIEYKIRLRFLDKTEWKYNLGWQNSNWLRKYWWWQRFTVKKPECKTVEKTSLLVWVTEKDDTGFRSDTPVTKYYSLSCTWEWAPGI